ncbi:MAG: ABC transporter ATP-binding protein/permease [Oscillospiraceae bacterium]|jgi:ABC-type multidrug transport system fused ATPase/permease subunit|nr:ABC transporter ATP-binding protein/permease [Oscillospiraceae bacterium]
MKNKEFINKTTAAWIWRQTIPFLPRLLLIIALNSVVIFANIYLTILTKNLIDTASSLAGYIPEAAGAGIGWVMSQIPDILRSQPEILRNIILYVLIILLDIGISMTASFMSVYLSEKFEFYIRRRMFDTIIRAKWRNVTAYHSGDLMVRLTSDIHSLASGIINVLSSVVILIVSFAASFVTLMYFDPSLALFAFALGPIAVALSMYSGKRLKSYQTRIQESEANYRSHMQENIANITVVKSFTSEDRMSGRLYSLYRERMKLVVKRNRLSIVMGSIIGFTYSIGYLAALVWGIIKISLNMMSFGTLTIFLSLVGRVQSPVLGLAKTVPTISSIFASAARIVEIDTLPVEDYEAIEIGAVSMGIRFQDIDYSYHTNEVFKGLNLDIKPGSLVAITGSSGLGKTTLIRLMMNYVDAQSGTVTFYYTDEHGNPTESLAAPGIRDYISYVPQGNTLFSGSIRSNLLLGNPSLTDEEIYAILKSATLFDYVMSLPDGIDTVVGEKGHGLSEGQAERIAIARALAKKAPVVIFDEATSALDEQTEQRIIQNIKELENGPTCIFITHKLGILPFLDEEIKLGNVVNKSIRKGKNR